MAQRIKTPYIIAAILFAVFLGLFSLFNLYQNSKTDGFGDGSIRVDQCKEKDWAWKIYDCQGFYRSGAGMIETKDVSIQVSGREYKNGDLITDVYAPPFVSNSGARTFIEGKERSSVVYNAPLLTMLFVSIGTVIAGSGYLFATRSRRKK